MKLAWLTTPPRTKVEPKPDLVLLKPGGPWRMKGHVRVYDDRHGRVWEIPRGRETDKASIPRAAFSVISRDDCGDAGPSAHDEIYRHGGRVVGRKPVTYTRLEADRLLVDLMRVDGVPRWRCALVYAAVRAFGASAWRGASPEAQAINAATQPPEAA